MPSLFSLIAPPGDHGNLPVAGLHSLYPAALQFVSNLIMSYVANFEPRAESSVVYAFACLWCPDPKPWNPFIVRSFFLQHLYALAAKCSCNSKVSTVKLS